MNLKGQKETAFTIGSGNLIPSTKAGWQRLKLTGKGLMLML